MRIKTIKTEECFSVIVDDGEYVFSGVTAWEAWENFFMYFGG